MKTRIAIIGTVGLPANYGGFETLTEHLVEELSDTYDMTVYCSGKKYPKNKRSTHYKNAKLVYLPFDANGMQSIIYDCISILHAIMRNDVLVILGVSGGIILPFVRLFTNVKIITSIDGIEWKREKWGKLASWYLWYAEMLCVKFSHADIADNESIQDYTAKRYKSLSNIIEYGGDHTITREIKISDYKRFPFLCNQYAFSVCRIEPENNVHLILEAFSRLPHLILVFVGNWNKNEYGVNLKDKYNKYKNLYLLDPIYNQEELDLLRGNCRLYIHGHSAGGTNPSLVEAMWLGRCIFSFDVSYNRTTTQNKAYYFRTLDQLIDLLSITSSQEINNIANRMLSISRKRYSWKFIANRYNMMIKGVLNSSKSKKIQPSIISRISESDALALGLSHMKNSNLFYENR